MRGKHIITTDNWFYSSDGKQYKAVYGDVEVLQDSFLGIKTNLRSSNWFVKISGKNEHIIIAGCQIHYVVKTDIVPNADIVEDYQIIEGVYKSYERPNTIYIVK